MGHQARIKHWHVPRSTATPAGSWGCPTRPTPENCFASRAPAAACVTPDPLPRGRCLSLTGRRCVINLLAWSAILAAVQALTPKHTHLLRRDRRKLKAVGGWKLWLRGF